MERSLVVLAAMVFGAGCKGDAGSEAPGKAPNWWCNATVCERTREKCRERGGARSPEQAACSPHESVLCASLRDAKHGGFEMCFPDLDQCMEMIELTERIREMEISKTRDLKPEDRFRPLRPEDEVRCEDRS